MNLKKEILLLISMSLMMLQSCSTTKNNIYWVSGIKTPCSSGAGKMNCLNVHKGKDLSDSNWEHFYANIEGFEFEEGYMKKIKVKETKLNLKDVPADGSSIKYELVEELDKQPDHRALVKGKWILNRFNEGPVNRSVTLPTMEITLNEMSVSGSGGCNMYSGPIEQLSSGIIRFGNMASTRKACFNKNIESEYLKAMGKVKTYQIKESNLIFYNEEGKEILSYMKQEEQVANYRLHDIWTAVRINRNPINRMVKTPRLEINLKKNKIFGNDGCNEFSGPIKEISDTRLIFGNIVSTRKMCREMDITDSFNEAMHKVTSYKIEKLTLILTDSNGKEVLAFLKGD